MAMDRPHWLQCSKHTEVHTQINCIHWAIHLREGRQSGSCSLGAHPVESVCLPALVHRTSTTIFQYGCCWPTGLSLLNVFNLLSSHIFVHLDSINLILQLEWTFVQFFASFLPVCYRHCPLVYIHASFITDSFQLFSSLFYVWISSCGWVPSFIFIAG